jgi:hypothetical protein
MFFVAFHRLARYQIELDATPSFDELREQTWELPFIPKYYRAVLKPMERTEITITRITSKRDGIAGKDRIRFK